MAEFCRPRDELPDPAECKGLATGSAPWSIRFKSDRSVEQTAAVLSKWKESLAVPVEGGEGAGVPEWSLSTTEAFEDFCTKHITISALHVLAFVYDIAVTSSSTQTSLVVDLVAIKAAPFWVPDLRDFYARYQALVFGLPDPGQEFSAPEVNPHEAALGVDPADTDARLDGLRANALSSRDGPPISPHRRSPSRSRSRSRSRHNGRRRSPSRDTDHHGRSEGRDPSHGPDRRDGRGLSKRDMEDFSLILAGALNRSSENDGAQSGLSKYEDFLKKTQRLVDNQQIVAIELLGSEHRAKLVGSSYASTKIRLGGGLYISKAGCLDDSRTEAKAVALREGMDVYIRLHRESSSSFIRSLAADRALFNEKLWSLPLGTFTEKGAYLKDFIATYHMKEVWTPLIRSDVLLIQQHLRTPVGGSSGGSFGGGRGNGRDRDRDRGSDRGKGRDRDHVRDRGRDNARDRGRDSRGRGGRGSEHGGKPNGKGGGFKPDRPFCKSRVDPRHGRCDRGKGCDLDHACASCGGMHCAEVCSSFNKVKADKAVDDRKKKLHGGR